MRGYCKCDLCGSIYEEKDNHVYDGITLWRKGSSGNIYYPGNQKLCTPDGKYITDIPATMDLCPDCIEKFYNWIRMNREEAKSPVKDDFPMNKPE